MKEKLAKLHKYSAAITFLAMEIFALIAFSFGASFVLYGALSLALMILLIVFNIKEINSKGLSSIAILIIPLFLFTILSAVGAFSRAHIILGDFSIADVVFIPLGLMPVAFIGYLLSIDEHFKLSTFLIVIYGALAILTLINLIVNIVNFGPMYTIIFKGYYMYYGGQVSEVSVDKFAYILEGFKFIEVKMEHYVLFPALLLTSSIALPFISPKENKKKFVIYSVFSFIALLALILVPTFLSLFVVLLIGVIDGLTFLIRHFKINFKPFKTAIYVLLALGGLGLFIVILNNQSFAKGLSDMIASNSFLNRLFNSNRFMNRFNPLVEDIFSSRFLGFYDVPTSTVGTNDFARLSGSILFDNFATSGVIGNVAFVVILVLGFKAFYKYFKNESLDSFNEKVVLLGFTLFFVIYSLVLNDGEYGIFYNIVNPIYMSGPFMIMLFIFGYVYSKTSEDKTVAEVVSKESEEKEYEKDEI